MIEKVYCALCSIVARDTVKHDAPSCVFRQKTNQKLSPSFGLMPFKHGVAWCPCCRRFLSHLDDKISMEENDLFAKEALATHDLCGGYVQEKEYPDNFFISFSCDEDTGDREFKLLAEVTETGLAASRRADQEPGLPPVAPEASLELEQGEAATLPPSSLSGLGARLFQAFAGNEDDFLSWVELKIDGLRQMRGQ